ncbi:MAG: zeta toxin family protein [Chromatiales bacterium]|nr:zeta toxin family protein [Chromatiales bacterium]
MSATLDRPRYTVLGGPNGAGKSTTFARLTEWGYRSGAFLNPDEIAKELDGPEPARAVAAGRETLRRSRAWMARRRSFVRESTLSSREIVRSAQAARDAGYRVTLIFVGLNTVCATKNRVRVRARSGGHAIPVRDQERRFLRSFDNAPRVAAIADEAYFLDNVSGQPRTVAVVHGGIVLFRDTTRTTWVERATAGLVPARPMWGRGEVLAWVRRAEGLSDELREGAGSYEAEVVAPAAIGARP